MDTGKTTMSVSPFPQTLWAPCAGVGSMGFVTKVPGCLTERSRRARLTGVWADWDQAGGPTGRPAPEAMQDRRKNPPWKRKKTCCVYQLPFESGPCGSSQGRGAHEFVCPFE